MLKNQCVMVYGTKIGKTSRYRPAPPLTLEPVPQGQFGQENFFNLTLSP
jgi:hypothetical protein